MADQPEPLQANGWYVLLEVVRGILRLAQTGNIIGLVLIALIAQVAFVTYKLTPEMLDRQMTEAYHLLSREKFYIFPLCATILAISFFCFYRCRMLKEEIKRISEVRSALIHGLEHGTMQHLAKHHPSNYTPE